MGAPGTLFRDSKYISFSFLADNTIEAINSLLLDKNRTKEQRENLGKASLFLTDAALGADFVSTGKSKAAFNANTSLDALNCAMGPIESRKEFLPKGEDPTAYFTRLAETVKRASEATRSGLPSSGELTEAKKFFVGFYDWLQAEMDTRRPETGAFNRKGSAYA